MTRFQFAKLVQWAGTLRSRKRIQKLVYLLKAAGLPTDAEYILHVFGPYSFDVARLTDELARVGLLEEIEQPAPCGSTFDYKLTDRALRKLRELELTDEGQRLHSEIARFEPLVQELAEVDVAQLEVAATIVWFQQREQTLDEACAKIRAFKGLPPDSALVGQARELAQRFVSESLGAAVGLA